MKIKNILFLFGILILFGVVTAGTAEAVTFNADGNPGDTITGTVITAEASKAELNYTDVNGNPKEEVNPADDIEITVLSTYGFSMALFEDQNMYVNKIVSNESAITLEGNASDDITITFEASFVDVTGTWAVKIKETDTGNIIGTLTSGSPSVTTVETLSEDAHFKFFHEVLAPDTDGTPGAHIIITTEASTANSPVGRYTGANGLDYGGPGSTSETTTYTLYKPLMQLTRTSTVDAPNAYTGDVHDAVPGSVITYTLEYSNLGNTSAAYVVIVDKIPTPEAALQTNIAHFNADLNSRTNVTISAGSGDAAPSWTIYYTTEASAPDKSYGAAGWTLVGTITANEQFPGNELYTSTSTEYGARWVKWEKSLIADTEDEYTLTYGVTIR